MNKGIHGDWPAWSPCPNCGSWTNGDEVCQECGYGPGDSPPHKPATPPPGDRPVPGQSGAAAAEPPVESGVVK